MHLSNNLFVIICRTVTPNLYYKYSKLELQNIIFISDNKPELIKPNIIYYDNSVLIKSGFTGMHSKIKITSWDKAFYYLKNKMHYDYYWIIEDDCYLNKNLFVNFINNNFSKNNSDAILFGWHKKYIQKDSWPHWIKNKGYFNKKHLSSSINQIIRISPTLLNKILNFKKKYNKFIFHELLIASLICQHNLTKTIVKRPDIDCCALQKNSVINKNTSIIDIQNKYIIIHPFKLWYDSFFLTD